MTKTALIVGGNGIIGRNMATYLESTEKWKVIITSHSALSYDSKSEFVQLDLTDPDAVEKQKNKLKDVTHIFYGAYIEQKTLALQTSVNTLLLENLIMGIEKASTNFEHIVFIQGGKAYGAHLGMYKTPAKETDARHFPPNFYYNQEDILRNLSIGKRWSWTALRPDIIIGMAIGNPMNLATLIAIYATLCKELNVPMRFPGNEKAYDVLVNVTDAKLLARGMEYVAVNKSCHNDIFNITNGDIFRWKDVWTKIGEYFEVDVCEPQTFSLQTYMADKNDLWDEIVKKYNLANYKFEKLVQWAFGDFIFNNTYDAFFDVNKFRRHGFQDMHFDSFDSFRNVFEELKAGRIIP